MQQPPATGKKTMARLSSLMLSDRLSTIPEGSNEDDQNSDNPEGVFQALIAKHFDKPAGDEEKVALHDLWLLHQDTVEQCAEQLPVEEIPMVYVSPEDPY